MFFFPLTIFLNTAGKAEKPILEQKTVQTLFEGALTETGSAMISAMLAFVDPFAYKDKLQWSTGLAVCTSDWPNGRKKGTAACEFIVLSVPRKQNNDALQGEDGQIPIIG